MADRGHGEAPVIGREEVVVLDYGRKIADGTPDAIKADKQVIDAYLGVAH